jgi:predicted house-cleaning noncanonical NTP pyrophosphatase (MazG superfamily)
VWIVQCDDASDSHLLTASHFPRANEIVEAFAKSTNRSRAALNLRHFSDTSNEWQKLARPKMFRELDMPTSSIFVITGRDWECGDSESRAKTREALRELCDVPVVIRCDVSRGAALDELLLPTSKATTDAEQLFKFMDEQSARFRVKGLDPDSWAFLPAPLVAARASAMIHAYPGAQAIRVDALWGYPDGISYYPHDSYLYYPSTKKVASRIRFKSLCILPDGDGWLPHAIDPPLDWAAVLKPKEVQTLAIWASRLSQKLEGPVQLMALVGVPGVKESAGCVPWHYTALEVPAYRDIAPPHIRLDALKTIRNRDDLNRLRSKAREVPAAGIRILPEPSLLRDTSFLEEISAIAAELGLPIYFEGSVLGHAYFILARGGAAIIPLTDEFHDRKVYQKLVRDLIPAVVHRAGGLARVRRVPRSQAHALLRQKLIEEAFELRAASASELIEEIADVLEVVDAIVFHSGFDASEIDRVRQEKRISRGGFQDLVYLEETDIGTFQSTETEGHLPLFLDDEGDAGFAASSMRTEWLRRESPDSLASFEGFSISLIPPASDEAEVANLNLDAELRRTTNAIKIGGGGRRDFVRVVARYTGNRVTIRLVPITVIETADEPLLPFLEMELES